MQAALLARVQAERRVCTGLHEEAFEGGVLNSQIGQSQDLGPTSVALHMVLAVFIFFKYRG